MNTPITVKRGTATGNAVTAAKALGLVAVAWGGVYPALLWGLGAVLG